MKKVLFVFLLLAVSINAQVKKSPKRVNLSVKNPCSLTISEAPKLRGFYLGQAKDELSNIPYFLEEYEKKKKEDYQDRVKFGWLMINSVDLFYRTPGVRTVPIKDLEDVEFYLHFLDNNIMFISMKYTQYEPDNLNSFIKQVSETTILPVESWKIKDKYNAEMSCNGFDVSLWTGNIVGRDEYSDYPTLSISNKTAELEIDKREKAYKKKLIEDEKERKRQEEKKRRTFKP